MLRARALGRGGSCTAPGSSRRRGGPARPGGSSARRRPRASWPATCSLWTPCSYRGGTCCGRRPHLRGRVARCRRGSVNPRAEFPANWSGLAVGGAIGAARAAFVTGRSHQSPPGPPPRWLRGLGVARPRRTAPPRTAHPAALSPSPLWRLPDRGLLLRPARSAPGSLRAAKIHRRRPSAGRSRGSRLGPMTLRQGCHSDLSRCPSRSRTVSR